MANDEVPSELSADEKKSLSDVLARQAYSSEARASDAQLKRFRFAQHLVTKSIISEGGPPTPEDVADWQQFRRRHGDLKGKIH